MFAPGYYGARYWAPRYFPPGAEEGGQRYEVSIGLSATAALSTFAGATVHGSVSLPSLAALSGAGAAAGLSTIDLATDAGLRAAGRVAGELIPVGGRLVRINAAKREVRHKR